MMRAAWAMKLMDRDRINNLMQMLGFNEGMEKLVDVDSMHCM